MKSITHAILIIAALLCCTGIAKAQYAVGDYGSTSSGNWNVASTWSTWNGASWTPAVSFPNSSNNAFILAGRTVVLPATGPYNCQNLTVEAGAKLWTANSATNIYLYVYGTAIVCNGQIGDGIAFDGMSFGIEGASCTLSGTGIFNASRIRKNSATAPTTNFTIGMDVGLTWGTVASTQIYNGANNNSLFNVTVNAGATLTLAGTAAIDGLTGTDVIQLGGTFTINGTMIIPGRLYLTTNNTNTAYSCNWIINGLIMVNEISAPTSGAGGNSLLLNAGGRLNITGTAAFSALGTLNNSYTFNVNSTVEYSAAGNQGVRVRAEFAAAPTAFQEYGHLILSGSGLKSTNNAAGLFVKNDLTITGSAVLDPNPVAIPIFVGGHWINYGSAGFLEKTTTVYMNGAALQTITCPGGEVYNTLRYQKTGSFLQFNNNVDVITQLIYASNGYIDLNSNTFTVRSSLTTGIQGATNNRYIYSEKVDNSSRITWKIGSGSGTYTFPFGMPPGGAANYVPVVINKTSNDVGDVTLSTYGTGPNNLPWPTTPTNVTNLWANMAIHNAPDNRHWTVDRFWEVRSTSPSAVTSLTFNYRTTELPDSDATPTNLGAQFWDAPIGYWDTRQWGTGVANNVMVPGFIDFNTAWTLTSLTSPLPVELLSFTATPMEDMVRLRWTTASEINNDYFTVEKSADGRNFFTAGTLPGARNSTWNIDYSMDDTKPLPGVSYYRLKQTDFDGTYTYSKIVPVRFSGPAKQVSVFPNPAEERVYVVHNSDDDAEAVIRNSSGSIVRKFILERNTDLHELNTKDFAKGIYFIEIRTQYETHFLRLVRN